MFHLPELKAAELVLVTEGAKRLATKNTTVYDPLPVPGIKADVISYIDIDALLAENAVLRLNSCYIGNGEPGRKFCRYLGNGFLGGDGGSLYTSQVQIYPNLVDAIAFKLNTPQPPQWLRNLGDHASVAMGPIIFADFKLNS